MQNLQSMDKTKQLLVFALAAVALLALPLFAAQLLPLFTGGGFSAALGGLLPLVWHAVYTLLLVSSAYYQISGIKLS